MPISLVYAGSPNIWQHNIYQSYPLIVSSTMLSVDRDNKVRALGVGCRHPVQFLFPPSFFDTASLHSEERSIPHAFQRVPSTTGDISIKGIKMKRPQSSSSCDSSPNDKRSRSELYDPDEVWEVDAGPEPFIDLSDLPPIPPAALGYRGQFALWTPDHVTLESADGHKFSVSKAALGHSR
jgi:hypothetical protein